MIFELDTGMQTGRGNLGQQNYILPGNLRETAFCSEKQKIQLHVLFLQIFDGRKKTNKVYPYRYGFCKRYSAL